MLHLQLLGVVRGQQNKNKREGQLVVFTLLGKEVDNGVQIAASIHIGHLGGHVESEVTDSQSALPADVGVQESHLHIISHKSVGRNWIFRSNHYTSEKYVLVTCM